MNAVHPAAAEGFARGSETYSHGRPSYHPAALDMCVERLGRQRWVDLGAGTGIATRQLVDRGVDVIAVEPVASMRVRLSEVLPRVEVFDGTSAAMPVGAGEAAVVLAAQAFHWFDHVATLNELVRVLEPGGALVTLWNVRDESVPWVTRYTELVTRHAGSTPRWHTQQWRRAIVADGRFELEVEKLWPNPVLSSPDLVVARLLSTSFIAALGDELQRRLADELRAVVAPLGEHFDYPYETHVQIWRHVGGAPVRQLDESVRCASTSQVD